MIETKYLFMQQQQKSFTVDQQGLITQQVQNYDTPVFNNIKLLSKCLKREALPSL